MKQIIVENCYACPYESAWNGQCKHAELVNDHLATPGDGILPDCPLDDMPEKTVSKTSILDDILQIKNLAYAIQNPPEPHPLDMRGRDNLSRRMEGGIGL